MSEAQTPFRLRGWGIRAWNSPEQFEQAVDRAIAEAPKYGINAIDLHDGAIPPGIGWLEIFAEYRQIQALRGCDALTYYGHRISQEERDAYRRHFRAMCSRLKAAGLQIQVWYHVLRDLPEEWIEAEPTVSRLDGRRLWQVLGSIAEDFLQAVPEVDTLVATADQAPVSASRDTSSMASGERLRAIYQCLYEACRRQRRKLIVRETGKNQQERDSFIYAIGPLPPDIDIMVKDVQGDWYHLNAPLNPVLYHLKNKNIVVETDLYGEHWGRLEMPLCRLPRIHSLVRSWLHLPIVGAVGRIRVVQQADSDCLQVFDTPNAANVAAFGQLLSHPLPDRQYEATNVDAFDLQLWLDWLYSEYGKDASPYVIAALDRTPRIVQRVFYLGGAYFQDRSYLPTPSTFERQLWPTFLTQSERLGIDVLRWEKEVALRLVRQSLGDLELAGPSLRSDDYDCLLRSLGQARDVAMAYLVLIDLCIGRLHPDRMAAATTEARDLANRIEGTRGAEFFDHLPDRLRLIAQHMADVTRGVEVAIEEEADTSEDEDEPLDLDDLSPNV